MELLFELLFELEDFPEERLFPEPPATLFPSESWSEEPEPSPRVLPEPPGVLLFPPDDDPVGFGFGVGVGMGVGSFSPVPFPSHLPPSLMLTSDISYRLVFPSFIR